MSIFSKIKARVNTTKLKVRTIAAGFALGAATIAAVATVAAAGATPVSTPDCNANAVVWCGASTPAQLDTIYHASGGDGHNTSASIQRVYSHFGIDGSKIDNLKNTYVKGYVTKSGDVYATIDGQNTLVATGAMTAGRQLITSNGKTVAGQTKYTVDGTTFYTRAPSVSFLNDELTAMVSMQNGQFQFAILVSCGNPVTATPKKPNYTITKQVSNGGSYASSVSNVRSGSTLKYQITVSSTGQVPVKNVKVHDTLPVGLAYVKGSLQQDGKAVTGTNETNFFGSGVMIASIKNGSKIVFTFQAKAGSVDYADSSCKPATLNNTGYITAPSLPNENSSAQASTICAPAASLACTSLAAVAGSVDTTTGNQKYAFTAKASASNVTIKAYTFDFGDGSSKATTSTANTDHTYKPGTWTANVVVTGVAPATNKTYTTTVTQACEYKVTVKPPVSGTLACTGLTAVAGTPNAATGETQYTLKATGQVSGNAKITNYIFTPGDNGADATVTTGSTSASTTHTYKPGNYTATVDVNGTDLTTGKAISAPTNAKCSVPITVKQPVPSSLACTGLTLTAGAADAQGNTQYTLKATASETNAHISTYTYTFGDGGTTAVASTATSANATHTYAPGTYTASVAVSGKDAAGKTLNAPTNPKCSAPITVKITECKPGVPVGSPQCKPSSLACEALGAVLGDDDATYSFTATASVDNATLTTYTFDFGDKSQTATVNTSTTTAKATHTYAPGTYTASVAVSGKDAAGNAIQAPANPKCSMPINVKSPECKPGVLQGSKECFTYTCNLFTLSVDNDKRIATVASFDASSTNTAAAKLTNVLIDWGDGASSTVAAGSAIGAAHTFTANSSTVTATPQFTVGDSTDLVNGTTCSQPVSFTTTPPPVLPNTGAGNVIGIFVGTAVAATIGFRLYSIRKLSRS